VTNQHQLLVVLREGLMKLCRGISVEASKDLRIRACNSRRGFYKTLAVRVFANRKEQFTNCCFSALVVKRPAGWNQAITHNVGFPCVQLCFVLLTLMLGQHAAKFT